MTFVESTTPDITEPLVAALSPEEAAAYPIDAGWDVTFGEIGFRLRPTPQYPYRRETERVSREQIDTSDEAGEQSLSSWWTRSQTSWHLGAGVKWYEPGAEEETQYRFANSQGVDVWTPGELKLLPKMEATEGNLAAYLQNLHRIGEPGILLASHSVDATELIWVAIDGPEGGYYRAVITGAPEITRPTTAGSSVWVGVDGGVVHWDLSTADELSAISPTYTCTGTPQAWWAKSRVIVALGSALYELTPGAESGALTSVATQIYEHPDSEWQWVAVAETGEAILAAGVSGGSSGVFRITIEQDETGMPVLSGASQVASLPPGEQISCMGIYLGTMLVLGTSRGIRIGVANESGVVQYGPLTVELSQPPSDVLFDDRFAYVAVTAALPDGSSGLVRIDLSAPVDETGRFAWAWDLSAGLSAPALSVSRLVATTDGATETVWYMSLEGYIVQTLTRSMGGGYVDEGWIESGRIRFRTVEPKAFRLTRAITELNDGEVQLTAVTPDDVEHRVYTYRPGFTTSQDVGITIPGRPTNQYLSLRIKLRPNDDGDATPVVRGYSLKAVPAPSRMRLLQFPVSVYDFETTRHGQTVGMEGGALRRLLALERAEDAALPITVRHLASGDSFTGMIESVQFSSEAPPDGNQSGFGGVALVTVRKL
jgi:hypothetical protein